ncbi:hypothetical protein NO2_0036 [Candidatus Termititenax persephonae]|uniref:Uncharacterized protein n=1 Tax=Candidatus Termititenax persephonae TaxID=2218525 RepID=A0A388TGJ7_9BACT|nr:hypothetical protein NO2_0036 [Candidatus Termititenax persephonae]
MLKKLTIIGLMASLFLLTGCGVNIRQEDNKVYTSLSKDRVYEFTTAALQTKGYTIVEEDADNYKVVSALPEDNATLGAVETDNKHVEAVVTDGSNGETVVTILALLDGNIDEAQSRQIAQEAVAEIIAELDKYGRWSSRATTEYVYPVATTARVKSFIEDYLEANSLLYQANGNVISLQERTANHVFNEPLTAVLNIIASGEAGRTVIGINTSLDGNYDVNGNQAYIENFNDNLTAYLDTYPVVEKGTRHIYRFIDFPQAYVNARTAIAASGYTIKNENQTNYVFSAVKKDLNLSVTFTQVNAAIGVNIEAFIEGAANETKTALSDRVTEELFNLAQALAAYQTVLTSEKIYLSNSQPEILGFARQALAEAGYTYTYDANEYAFSAISKVNPHQAHYLLVNNLGSDGIAVQINTLYNANSSSASAIVRAENDKLLRLLGSYDKLK